MSRNPRKSQVNPAPSLPIARADAARKIKVGAAGETKRLDALPDMPDIRDRFYEPPLIELRTRLNPPGNTFAPVLDQGTEGSCTGFALATTINLLLNRRLEAAGMEVRTGGDLVSPRMLYEMARIHDEWAGEDYDGSSVRGALKGFYHNGICRLAVAPYLAKEKDWRLTVPRAKDARNIGLGAYYRLRPNMIDYHAALNQAGAIYVSAQLHDGWRDPQGGRIELRRDNIGGHAFVIVGYDDEGFLIQNSWGTAWGGFKGWSGIAHWSYADWSRNIVDAWALRLAVPTPAAFDLTHIIVAVEDAPAGRTIKAPEPRREDILGHFAHLDDGKFVTKGKYATDLENIVETADYLAKDAAPGGKNEFRHLMIYAHGGLNNDVASALRIARTKEAWKRNGIYPFHFMWETGFFEEFKDILVGKFQAAAERVGGILDFRDHSIETLTRGLGLAIWREMKRDAERAFAKSGGGFATMRALLAANAKQANPRPVHLIGHSAGAIFIAEMLKAMPSIAGSTRFASVSLMAPACTVDVYRNVYGPSLKGGNGARIPKLVQYNLTNQREEDDTVLLYGKSLLYLVRNAYEEKQPTELLGMEIATAKEKLVGNHTLWYSGRHPLHTDARSHGGFDTDRVTANDILETILGTKPKPDLAFRDDDLQALAALAPGRLQPGDAAVALGRAVGNVG